MARNRIPFLPLFLAALTVAFVVAVTLRARSYAKAGTGAEVVSHTENAANEPLPPGMYRDATGALIPLPGSENGATFIPAVNTNMAGRSSAGLTRAERLRQLLSEPLAALKPSPALAVQKAPPVQTQVAPKPQPPAVKPPVNTSRGLAGSGPQGGAGQQPGNKNTGDDSHHGPKDNDPNSDTQPPQLISAVFDPPQVHDGEDGIIVVLATDDISGVRGISGTIVSPSGKALQGFSCQPDGATPLPVTPGAPGRFIGHVNIPKDAEEGTWRVNFMSLSDNASNTATLHLSTGGVPATAVLKVISSNPDKDPPTLNRVWLDRTQIKSGDRNVVYVDASDNQSVKYVSGVFLSPAKFARISFGCQKTNDADTTWNCTMSTPPVLDCGNWQLEQVQLQDGANNMATVRLDNPVVGQVKLNILGDSCDSTPPVLQMMAVDPRVVSNQGGKVTLTATVTDDIAGVYGVMAQAVGPGQGSGTWTPLTNTGGNIWSATFNVPTNAGKGTWHLAFVQVIDKGNNLKLYTQSDPPLVNATFDVR